MTKDAYTVCKLDQQITMLDKPAMDLNVLAHFFRRFVRGTVIKLFRVRFMVQLFKSCCKHHFLPVLSRNYFTQSLNKKALEVSSRYPV